jgi:hypothetical protein
VRTSGGDATGAFVLVQGWTSKPTFLAQHGRSIRNPALPDEDFDKAVRIA